MFLFVSAYLAKQDIKATTHAGLKTIFNKELVKTGKVNREDGRVFNNLFGLRQEADYEDFYNVNQEDIEEILPKIQSLIQDVETIIKNE